MSIASLSARELAAPAITERGCDMEAAKRVLMAFGAVFSPLPNADLVGDFIDLEAAFPDNMPQRVQFMHEELVNRGMDPAGGSWAIDGLVKRLANWPRFRRIVLRLRKLVPESEQPLVLVSPAERCESCQHASLEIDQKKRCVSSPTVYTSEGCRTGMVFHKCCRRCGALHGLSFATGGHIPEHHMRAIKGCHRAGYFQLNARSTAYSVKDVLRRFTTQAVHSHTAFETFCSEYYDFTGDKMGRHSFSTCYVMFALIMMLDEYEYKEPIDLQASRHGGAYRESGETEVERTIKSFIPLLSRGFTSKWAGQHATFCRQPGLCNCWIFDGHMKCRRVTCDNNKAREIVVPEVGTMVLGCSRTPLKDSRFCFHCRAGAARLNPQQCEPCDSEPAAKAMRAGTSEAETDAPEAGAGHSADDSVAHFDEEADDTEHVPDERTELSPVEQSTYLVEKLIESRPARKKNEDTTYRTKRVKECMTKNHKEYLVKFVDYEEECWVCQCDIGRDALAAGCSERRPADSEQLRKEERERDSAQWRAKHIEVAAACVEGPPSARTRHAGERAADMQDANQGELRPTLQDDTVECNNLKEDQYAGMIKRTTAGVLALVSSCGLFLAVDELIGSESLKQVLTFLYAVFCIHGITPPKVLAYDDACHLLRWWQLRSYMSKFIRWLLDEKKVQLVVDRFHFKNHVGIFCKKWVDPEKCSALGPKTQTEAAEQSFSWLARSKHTLRHMNEGKFQFMVLHLMEQRNQWLVKRGVHWSK